MNKTLDLVGTGFCELTNEELNKLDGGSPKPWFVAGVFFVWNQAHQLGYNVGRTISSFF